jgi:uncharacterized phage-associated protein
MHSALDIAKWFLCNIDREAGASITHLKLQKLLYYAQAWYMVLSDDERPLFRERIEAWTHGPVVREVYNNYSEYGYDNLPIPNECIELDAEEEEVLGEVLRVYGKFDAKYLEELTHQELPWKSTRGNLPLEARCVDEIPLPVIKDFYSEMYQSNG